MRVGVIIGRIGDVDGAALETEKWIKILQEMGNEVYILSGRFKKSIVVSSVKIKKPLYQAYPSSRRNANGNRTEPSFCPPMNPRNYWITSTVFPTIWRSGCSNG